MVENCSFSTYLTGKNMISLHDNIGKIYNGNWTASSVAKANDILTDKVLLNTGIYVCVLNSAYASAACIIGLNVGIGTVTIQANGYAQTCSIVSIGADNTEVYGILKSTVSVSFIGANNAGIRFVKII